MPFRLITLVGAAALLLLPSVARATQPPLPGTRALGMGGALRGAATGDSALTLNPSGMSLLRAYIIEAMYAHDRISPGRANIGRLSIVDSTSGFNIAGGLYYNYLSQKVPGAAERSGHEGGGALSIPLGQYVFVGGAVKYFRLEQTGGARVRGFTFDAGLTVKPVGSVSIGVAGQNLADLQTDRAPRAVAGGVTVGAARTLLLAFDVAADLSTRKQLGSSGTLWDVMGGAEYTFAQGFGLRAGGGRRGLTKAGYFGVGASYIAQIGAIDLGYQQDVSGNPRQTFFSVSARLFLPAPE